MILGVLNVDEAVRTEQATKTYNDIARTLADLDGESLDVNVVGAWACQEEVGTRGATVTARTVKPDIAIDGVIDIKDVRHLVVELMQTEEVFVPNDCYLDLTDNRARVGLAAEEERPPIIILRFVMLVNISL